MNASQGISRRLVEWVAACVAICALLAFVSVAHAAFGIETFDGSVTDQAGNAYTQAGGHPFDLTTTIEVKGTTSIEGEPLPDGSIKDIDVAAPAGLVGNPQAVPKCTESELALNECEGDTQVGTVHIFASDGSGITGTPVFNMVPAPGEPAQFGFSEEGLIWVHVYPTVRSDGDYGLTVHSDNISQIVALRGASIIFWGVPADHAHDAERSCYPNGNGKGCASALAPKAFLTLPTSCTGPETWSVRTDSWQEPGNFLTASFLSHDNLGNPIGLTGCDAVSFTPTITAQPTSVAAQSPTGLDFSVNVNDEGVTSSTGQAQSEIKKVVVALPEAMSVNPALAEGLAGCSEADLTRETISSLPGEGCPGESKIGTVEVETPLLEQTLKGSLFLASQEANPFHSLLALYVVVKNPETGILLKLPGKVEPNETTGRLVSVFDNLPQLPFSHFRLSFRQGQRSPLVTPPVCGTYTTQAELTPWASPGSVLHDTATFQVTSGVGGGPCPTGSIPPFKPSLVAGTINNDAGSYSPLDIRITRNDGEQEITGLSTQLPPGLTANLTGVPFCSEADIALVKGKSGAQEESEPSCPVASQIGHTLVGVGVGSVLAYTPGRLYMAGPYEGAPFSVVAITSAKVGPFDLGTVIVHLPLNIDPNTATVSIPAGAADQIPHIVKGIVVHVRDIRVYVDRPNFTKNPTNCSPLSFGASVIGSGENFASPVDDVTAGLSNPFEVANCASLAFKPDFKVSTSGKTSKANGASLNVKLAFPNTLAGTQANIHLVKVELPKQLPSRLTTLQKACTAAQFAANPAGCPAASVVGHARAITPILPVPLEGPAYFVSHGGEAFPSLIVVLQGYGVTIDLVGTTFINKAGVTSSTFKTVPDQPVSSFELVLPQGPYSALTANGNLCSLTKIVTVKKKVTVRVKGHKRTVTRSIKQTKPASLTMPTEFLAQNGAVVHQTTAMSVTGCPKTKPAKKKAKPSKKASKKKG
jgi:hypothetical protein